MNSPKELKAQLAQAQKVMAWCLQSEAAKRINAMLDLARSEPGRMGTPGC